MNTYMNPICFGLRSTSAPVSIVTYKMVDDKSVYGVASLADIRVALF